MEDIENSEEDILPTPELNNLANIVEEFSINSHWSPKKRMKLLQCCVKDNVIYFIINSSSI